MSWPLYLVKSIVAEPHPEGGRSLLYELEPELAPASVVELKSPLTDQQRTEIEAAWRAAELRPGVRVLVPVRQTTGVRRFVGFNRLPVGAVWHSSIQPGYVGRRGWCIVLPGKAIWRTAERESGARGHWTVSGEAPHFTIHPAVEFVSMYRGQIRDGVIGDDLDGRRYDAHGWLLRGWGADA